MHPLYIPQLKEMSQVVDDIAEEQKEIEALSPQKSQVPDSISDANSSRSDKVGNSYPVTGGKVSIVHSHFIYASLSVIFNSDFLLTM